MDTAFKINSLVVNQDESVLFVGTNSGEILSLSPDNFAVLGRVQSNVGDIYALAAHPHRPFVASMGMDNFVSLWDTSNPSNPQLIDKFNLRRVSTWNDLDIIPRHPSQSQALCFHPYLDRIATRSANSGLVELDYSSHRFEFLHCTRLHGLEDLTTVRYVQDGSKLLSGALGSVVLSENGLILNRWRLTGNNVHWFEPVAENVYLIATDSRCVLLFDLFTGEILVEGPTLTRDDLEHVTYNCVSGRAFVAGFDRNIYEIDPKTCQSKGIVYQAPFKMRWIKTFLREPDNIFIQCFDGGVYKVNLARQQLLTWRRNTPPAIWTACDTKNGQLIFTGEGEEIVTVNFELNSDSSRVPVFNIHSITSKGMTHSYTKRMVYSSDGVLWLGQTSGHLIASNGQSSRILTNFNSAIRDLAVNCPCTQVFVCLENGKVCSIEANSGTLLNSWTSENNLPIWALALNPNQDILAIGERGGLVYFLDTNNLNVIKVCQKAGRIKRIKWLDNETLLYGNGDELYRYNFLTDQHDLLVQPCGNTIEDFVWNKTFEYLALVTYNTDLILCDLHTGEKLFISADQGDYSKGLMWLKDTNSKAYPLDLITFGRSGTAHLFRIHNNKCVSFGEVLPRILTKQYQLHHID